MRSRVIAIAMVGVAVLWSCGDDKATNSAARELAVSCAAEADTTFDPWDYLAWRDSRNSRFSSVTHALPCSAHVKAVPSSVPISDAIENCADAERELLYDVIGRYDQFIAGWIDVHDRNGNRVLFADVDSVENFNSHVRTVYTERCVQ